MKFRTKLRPIPAIFFALALATLLPIRDNLSAFADGRNQIVPSTVKRKFVHAGGIVQDESVVAIRSDGSQALTAKVWFAFGALHVIRFASGEVIYASDMSRLKSTVFDPARTASYWLRDPALNCVKPAAAKEIFSGIETVGGYRAAKIQRSPRGTSWFALDYSCIELQYTAPMSKTEVHFFQFVSLTPGEPSSDWFKVPSYKEVPPSEMLGSSKESDAYYYAHRPH